MCAFFISCYLVLTLMNFLGSAFGVQRCLNGCLSSYGQQLMMRYSPLIILLREGSLVNRCCLCYYDGESVDHLLLHYKFSHALQCEAFATFAIQWVIPRSVNSFFFIWRNCFGKLLSTIWNIVPTCLMWLIWQEHTTRIF